MRLRYFQSDNTSDVDVFYGVLAEGEKRYKREYINTVKLTRCVAPLTLINVTAPRHKNKSGPLRRRHVNSIGK